MATPDDTDAGNEDVTLSAASFLCSTLIDVGIPYSDQDKITLQKIYQKLLVSWKKSVGQKESQGSKETSTRADVFAWGLEKKLTDKQCITI